MSETFKIHLVVFQEWEAPLSEAREVLEEGVDRMDVDWEPEWHPSFEIVGAMSSSATNEFYSIKTADDWYMVHWRCDIKAEITDSMDLEEFPFDVEDLTITYRLRHVSPLLPLHCTYVAPLHHFSYGTAHPCPRRPGRPSSSLSLTTGTRRMTTRRRRWRKVPRAHHSKSTVTEHRPPQEVPHLQRAVARQGRLARALANPAALLRQRLPWRPSPLEGNYLARKAA